MQTVAADPKLAK
jgi:hypothetical protein